ncbi:MAG: hypothetical protein EOM85_02090 [Candidatus Moranbacteria bacterium]|nr:hypothetical protein [Candidatus Moranbacteria bacterium]
MDNTFQTSFIPKKNISTNRVANEPKSLFSMISIFLMIVSILASGGMYLYKSYLIKQESSLSNSLSKTRDTFEKDTIGELELFNNRVVTASQILSKHIVLSPLFSRLGEITIPSVQYKSFDYQSGTTGYTINLKGIAKDYRAIAQQSDAFNTAKGRSFKNVLFSDLTRDKNNKITFNLSFDVDADLLSYEKNGVFSTSSKPVTPVIPSTEEPVAPVTTEESTLSTTGTEDLTN